MSPKTAAKRNSSPVRVLRRTIRIVLLIVATIVVIRAFDTRTLPELAVWHKVALDEEFSAELEDDDFTFENYLEHELAAFDERDAKIASGLGDYPLVSTNRFNRDSVFASANQATDWNRSVELAQASPVGVALLLHGLSDSPYSMRGTAELLHAKGYRVLALRVPGHGTLPSGIMYSSWEDWAAAVRVAARYMTQEIDVGTPFVIVGYSNGGALAIDYALDALEGNGLRGARQDCSVVPGYRYHAFRDVLELEPRAFLAALFREIRLAVGAARVRSLQVQFVSEGCGKRVSRDNQACSKTCCVVCASR